MSKIKWLYKMIFTLEDDERNGWSGIKSFLFGSFWMYAALNVFLGAGETIDRDIDPNPEGRCTIERVAELHPGYLTGCFLFGKRLPKFKF